MSPRIKAADHRHTAGTGRYTIRPSLFPLLLLLVLLAATSAEAHADLLRADPAPNRRVDDPPSQFVLWFSEELEPRHVDVQVRDPDGNDHVVGLVVEPEERRRVDVETPELDPGLYTLRWEVLSAVDGHTTNGAYLVAVGMDIPEGTELPETDEVADIRFWETLARSVAYAGASLIAGIPAYMIYRFRFVPKKGGTHKTLPRRASRERTLMRVAAWGAIASSAAVFAMILGLSTRIGTGPVAAVATTSSGQMLAIRAALLLAAAALAFQSARAGRRLPWIAAVLVVALGALLATSLSAHAASTESGPRPLNIGIDFLHHAAAAAWVAGVLALLFTLPRVQDARTAGILVRDFSPFALGAVVLLVATGSYGALLHLKSPAALFPPDTGWTWALAAKILLVVPLIALGAVNRYRLQPRLLAGDEHPGLPRIKRSVRAEVLLMALVLVATGAITHATPPGEAPSPTGPLPGQMTDYETEDGDRFRVTVQPQPVRVGTQNVTVLMDPADEVPENAAVFLTIHSPEGDETGPLRLQRVDEEPRWWIRDAIFTESGGWHVIVLVQGRDYFEEFDFTVSVESG